MTKTFILMMSLWLAGTISCTHKPEDFSVFAKQSDTFRTLLLKYYSAKGHFPSDPDLLKEFDASFSFKGGLWNGWNYTAYDPGEYQIWAYPGRPRRSLWFKFNANVPAETGWFINHDNGKFQRQEIPLLPQELDLLTHGK